MIIELTSEETRLLLGALRLLVGEVEPAKWLDRLIAEIDTTEARTLTIQLNKAVEEGIEQ